jgi:multicomponent Na+:H+ antiporter subunit D
MSHFVMLPYLIYMGAAIASLLGWGRIRFQWLVSLLSTLLVLLVSLVLLKASVQEGILVHQLGGWAAPFGISYAVDPLGALLLGVSAFLGLLLHLYSWNALSEEHKQKGFYFLSQVMLLGVSASYATGDIFNLYVCFELLLISSYVLLSLGRSAAQLEASLKYVIFNFVASFCFLVGVAWVYGFFGTLNFAHLAQVSREGTLSGAESAALYFLFACFAVKAGLFPVFAWLPASYATPPATIVALFAALLTKVGVYALYRIFVLVFPMEFLPYASTLLFLMALATMVLGVLGAVAQTTIKRILAIHIISQVGYLLLALVLWSPAATAAGIYYMIHLMLAKTNLFLIGGIVEQETGTDDLNSLGSYAKRRPWLAINFLVAAMALTGLPPLSGFFAKLEVAYAAVSLENYGALFFIFAVSVLTLFSMLKIWNQVFWKEAEGSVLLKIRPLSFAKIWPQYLAIGVLNLAILGMGLGVREFYPYVETAAHGLWNSLAYVEAIMGLAR